MLASNHVVNHHEAEFCQHFRGVADFHEQKLIQPSGFEMLFITTILGPAILKETVT